MKAAERQHLERVAALSCCVCKRFGAPDFPGSNAIHHVAEGSGKRSWFAIARLCREHHQGATGIHGMGVRAFCRVYRPPGDKEEGLLVWTNEDLAERDSADRRR